MPYHSNEILAQMRALFAEQLPLRLDTIRQSVTDLSKQPWDTSRVIHLQHLLHNLIGASGTFGLPMIELSTRCLDDAVTPLANCADFPDETELLAVGNAFLQLESMVLLNNAEGERGDVSAHITVRNELPPLVYIVDDDPMQADVLYRILTENAYRARIFETLDAFRKACLEEPLPFAIIMDMIFPEGSEAGAQTIAELKYQYLGGLPIIFISVRNDLQARLAAFRAGATRYLHKPIQHTLLLRILNDLELNIPHKPYHVLLVDDDPVLLESHANILCAAGMVVRTETNPLNTLELLREFDADVLLLDVCMPECHGTELAAVIREQEESMHLPILFLSSESDVTRQLMALDFGGDDFLVKPVVPAHLVMAVKMRAQRMRRMIQMQETLNEGLVDFARVQEFNHELQNKITLHKQIEQELRITSSAFETQDAIMITDKDARILRVNESFQEITGYAPEEAIGQTPKILKSGRHDTAFYKEMWDTLSSQGKWMGEIWDKRKNGLVYPKWEMITAVYDNEGEVSHFVAVFRDLSESKRTEEEIRNLAFYDPLTGLPNRRLLDDRLRTAQFSGNRSQQYGALLFIDLDHFKQLNDVQGHHIGDLMLTEISRRLLNSVREMDVTARFGGDEFVVLLGDLSKDVKAAATLAGAVAEKICMALGRPYKLHGHEHHTTSSIGVALFRGTEQEVGELFKYADAAMYRAKSSGRNKICFFDSEMQAMLEARTELEAELCLALPEQQLQLYYQMQVDNYYNITGAEALLRWNHPKLGLVLPGQFILLAEETGLMLPIGEWVLQSACAQLKKWESDPLAQHLSLGVNISLRQLRQPDFVDRVRHTIESSGIDPENLRFEISEKVILANFDEVFRKIVALRKIGVRFVLDDFGVGYSSLIYLRRLPLDQVKIDKAFIASISENSGDDAMVRVVNNIAKSFGLQVIAEGVETREQLEILRRNTCESFQGYLFGRPVPLAEFEQLLK